MTEPEQWGNLWINSNPLDAWNSIHRISPSPTAAYAGGFKGINPFQIIGLIRFSTKSGPTITTML